MTTRGISHYRGWMRKAISVGLNDYASQPRLRGCVNDCTNVGLVLEQFAGFGSTDVQVISDELATKRDIEDQLEWLTTGARSGDLLVFHFSGHGSRVPDQDDPDEPIDRLDEILCPFDMAWDGTYITDDYLRRRLNVPPGVVLEVILDACHTGDGGAELGLAPAAPAAGPDRSPRFLKPPPSIENAIPTRDLPTNRLFRGPMTPRVALWSACGASQTAADARINGLFNGAFSFYFCKHIRESQGRLSRRELLAQIRRSLAAAGYSQIPELAAPPDLAAARPFQLL
jgi:metacaspase-1